jgi:hypothetical protein
MVCIPSLRAEVTLAGSDHSGLPRVSGHSVKVIRRTTPGQLENTRAVGESRLLAEWRDEWEPNQRPESIKAADMILI